jgi:hypothetical protein
MEIYTSKFTPSTRDALILTLETPFMTRGGSYVHMLLYVIGTCATATCHILALPLTGHRPCRRERTSEDVIFACTQTDSAVTLHPCFLFAAYPNAVTCHALLIWISEDIRSATEYLDLI